MTDARRRDGTGEGPRARTADSRRPAAPRLRATAPIVPPANVSGNALMLVIAIMSFLACLTLGAVSMVRASAATWESQISREITIQIQPADGLDMEAALKRARTIAMDFPGVTGARVMGKDATARLLQPWLGSGLNIDELPVPRLVVATIDEASPPDFAALRSDLHKSIPQATLDDHRTWVGRLVSMAETTVLIGLAILVLVFTATVLTVVFATRGAMSGNRHIVEVLHFVGAESRFVAAEFERHFLIIGLKGACAGGALAMLVFALAGFWQGAEVATPGSDQTSALFGHFALGFWGYLGILVIVGIVGGMTALTTRFTVIRTIHEIDAERAAAGSGEIS